MDSAVIDIMEAFEDEFGEVTLRTEDNEVFRILILDFVPCSSEDETIFFMNDKSWKLTCFHHCLCVLHHQFQ